MIVSGLAKSKASGVMLLAALLVLWQLSATYWFNTPNLPSLTSIAASLVEGLSSGELLGVFGSSINVMFVGYFLGTFSAVVVGLLMANVRWINGALYTIVELLRPIPIPAIVPPLILLLGIDNALKIFVVAFSVFFPVLINTVGGTRAVDTIALDVGRTFRIGRLRAIRSIILPASLPYILSGMRTSLSLALIITVTAEMIAGSAGIGYYLIIMQYAMRTPDMYAAIFLLALLGYALNAMFLAIERRVLHWYMSPF
jgi:ABC-type nitrate/sulfonate/bicarbonate transport system permease component